MDLYVLLYDGDLGSPPKFIGMTGLFNIDRPNDSCSMGILIHPDYFRGGFATQVLYTLMVYAFEDDNQHMHRIVFETGADNIQMRGWLENVVGAQMEFRWREAWKAAPGQWIDAVGYSILEHEWRG
ncbi:acyl-CoA N-acyltransferase [Phellopilus nigrolimitatus]|nr:acyl-CoA N-acyltransferase [Phellopilus nigrolimitatus]